MHTHHHPVRTGKVLRWSLGATVVFVLVEVLAGVQAQSLALLSDAGHNFTDALALMLALLGVYFGAKPADERKTFGYQRAGVLAAFVNALALLILSAYIAWESVHRFRQPREVDETTMFIVAGLGLLLNASIMWGLRGHHQHDLNVRAAFLHMLGDALGSVGILVGAWMIRETRWLWIDPALSLIIAALIVWTAWDVLRDSLNILLEGLPRGMRLIAVAAAVRRVEGVLDVHDLHIWSLGSNAHALSCHVLIDDMPPSESGAILGRINDVLCSRYQIHHTTIQFEHQPCSLQDEPCSIADPHAHGHGH